MGYGLTEKGEKWLWSGSKKVKGRPYMFGILESINEGESPLAYLTGVCVLDDEYERDLRDYVNGVVKEVEKLEREGYIESDDSAVADVYLRETGREL